MDLVGIVIALSLSLIQILTIFENIERSCTSISFIIATLCYLIIPNYMGQKVTDMSSSICEKVYNSAWYDADVSEQKSLLLVMSRRFHPLILTACKFYPMSLPSFEMILQMGISYCMFMRQI
ncbi:odorant receptor 4-like [Polyergus mexicanus]|uniref:odorant receptor 4-like n=1 Tax=Polyergus mexicanus TaxID=615972 RepID=UPI0038B60B5A